MRLTVLQVNDISAISPSCTVLVQAQRNCRIVASIVHTSSHIWICDANSALNLLARQDTPCAYGPPPPLLHTRRVSHQIQPISQAHDIMLPSTCCSNIVLLLTSHISCPLVCLVTAVRTAMHLQTLILQHIHSGPANSCSSSVARQSKATLQVNTMV